MRTTLTLDDDLVRELQERARQSHKSFKEIVNSAIRRGLHAPGGRASGLPPFKVVPKAMGFQPGIDPRRLNQLVDELETEDFEGLLSSDVSQP